MSTDEQIEQLESEKRACMERYDKQLNELWTQKHEAEYTGYKDGDMLEMRGRKVMVLHGKPLSQLILEDRGVY